MFLCVFVSAALSLCCSLLAFLVSTLVKLSLLERYCILHRQKRVTQKTLFYVSDTPRDLSNESPPMQWMCAIMSRRCSFAEGIQLWRLGLITFPHINHGTSRQDVSLGGSVLKIWPLFYTTAGLLYVHVVLLLCYYYY